MRERARGRERERGEDRGVRGRQTQGAGGQRESKEVRASKGGGSKVSHLSLYGR